MGAEMAGYLVTLAVGFGILTGITLLLSFGPPCVSSGRTSTPVTTHPRPEVVVAMATLGGRRHVYVYEGEGAGKQSVRMLMHTLLTACDLELYSVSKITPPEIKEGSWMERTALIAVGGGYDLGYKAALGHVGQKNIRDFVHAGGSYLGLCAGGYFGSDYIEFDKGGPYEVCGPRQLKFFSGLCTGPVFAGFQYGSEVGSHAALVHWEDTGTPSQYDSIHTDQLHTHTNETGHHVTLDDLYIYFNGGGHFQPYQSQIRLDPHNALYKDSFKDYSDPTDAQPDSYEVLARYMGTPDLPISIVKTHVGQGKAVLSGVHFEYNPALLPQDNPYLKDKLPLLKSSEKQRLECVRMVLRHLGIQTNRHSAIETE